MIRRDIFDFMPCGVPVTIYELISGKINLKVLDFGTIIQSLEYNGVDVVGGFDNIVGYIDSGEYQGSTAGRICNRLKNSEFVIDGVKYKTNANEGKNVVHGGRFGFNKKIWTVTEFNDTDTPSITFTYFSRDGEEGFPGNLQVNVKYTVENDAVYVNYTATTDKKTIINLTNHSYFNLNGYSDGNIEEHLIKLECDTFNETDVELIPSGNFTDVTGTPFDMRKERVFKDVLFGNHPKIKELGGLDTNFNIRNYDGTIKDCAYMYSKKTGIKMNVKTNQTSVLIYTANKIKETEPDMKGGVKQIPHFGACFETEAIPDSINHNNLDDTTLSPGQKYDKTTIFEFSLIK